MKCPCQDTVNCDVAVNNEDEIWCPIVYDIEPPLGVSMETDFMTEVARLKEAAAEAMRGDEMTPGERAMAAKIEEMREELSDRRKQKIEDDELDGQMSF